MRLDTFLKTHQIASEIINLISNAEAYCYIVSPYIKLWPQLERELAKASKKGKIFTFVIRDTERNGPLIKKLNYEFGFEVVIIKDLHLKLYMNEKECILTSMNLYDASQTNNLELGYKFRNTSGFRKSILNEYILEDSNLVRYKGNFEVKRELLREKVKEVKEQLKREGYCVDCSKAIVLDFNPYNAKYIRCKTCYYENSDEEMRYCHFCGKNTDKIFHQECRKTLIEYRNILKNEC